MDCAEWHLSRYLALGPKSSLLIKYRIIYVSAIFCDEVVRTSLISVASYFIRGTKTAAFVFSLFRDIKMSVCDHFFIIIINFKILIETIFAVLENILI